MIVALHTESGPRVVSLLARGAAAVPNGVRLSGAVPDLHGCRVGAPVAVGAGWVRVDDLEVRVVRSWSTSRVTVISRNWRPSPHLPLLPRRRARCPQRAISRLEVALHRRRVLTSTTSSGRCSGLVGLGRGLTPGGDDVLAGVLTGCTPWPGRPGRDHRRTGAAPDHRADHPAVRRPAPVGRRRRRLPGGPRACCARCIDRLGIRCDARTAGAP